MSHARREQLAERFPVHVTLKVVKGLPNLRRKEAFRELERAFAKGSERFGFRLQHYSVQTNQCVQKG